MKKRDFFISYNHRDKVRAKQIADIIKQEGYTVYIQRDDIGKGDDFIKKMNDFLTNSNGLIAVASKNYFESGYCEIEFWAAFNKHIKTKRAYVFHSFRIEDIAMPELTQNNVYTDLFNAKDVKETVLFALSNRTAPKSPTEKTTPQNIKNTQLYNLPPFNQSFCGRENTLTDIQKQFDNIGGSICLKQTITGLGGVGKTQIALAYAYRHLDTYKNAVAWIHAETETTIFNSCLHLANSLGINTGGDMDADKLGVLLQDWQSKNDAWLFVFDNVEKTEIVQPYISPQCKGHVLITSRKQDLGIGACKTINIDVFPVEEALDFMRSRLEQHPNLISNDIELTVLIRQLGYFPLALEQAAAYMQRAVIDCGMYLKKLDKKGLEVFEGDLSTTATDYTSTINKAFSISYEALKESAKQLFNLCTYMAPEQIPIDFFKQQADKFPEPLCNELKEEEEDEIIANLIDYSLVKRDGDFLNIHRFVQKLGREKLKDNTEWWGYCLNAMENTLPDINGYTRREHFDLFEQISPHAEAIEEYSPQENQAGVLCYLIGSGNLRVAHYNHALEWFIKYKNICERVHGEMNENTAVSYQCIASVYKEQGDYEEALEGYQKSLCINIELFGEEHEDTAYNYNDIANIYYLQRIYDKSLELYEKALAIRKNKLGEEHLSTAQIYNNMARVFTAQEKYDKALELYDKALLVCKKTYGEDHPNTAVTYSCIAKVFTRQKEYGKALELTQKALDIRKRILNEEHPDIAESYSRLAFIYNRQGEYDKAMDLYQRALSICEKVFGKDNPHTIQAKNNLEITLKNKAATES
ncbi:MAG: tetratricopeptide repeat protein [Defluviitaleaceae bacterium]|nr:tetratricopeptide repeat protein [Defluviitaleaceae bacterium]